MTTWHTGQCLILVTMAAQVTSIKDQKQYWQREGPYHYVPVRVFAESFQNGSWGQPMQQAFKVPSSHLNTFAAACIRYYNHGTLIVIFIQIHALQEQDRKVSLSCAMFGT